MVNIYKDSIALFIYTIIAIMLLCWLMWFLNKGVSNSYLVSKRYRDKRKRSTTYEFESSGVRSNLSVRSATHPLKLALLFILFDVEVSFFVILVTHFARATIPLQAVSI